MSYWDCWSTNEYHRFSANRKVYSAANSTASAAAVLWGRSLSDQIIKVAIKKSVSRRSPDCTCMSTLNPWMPLLSEYRVLCFHMLVTPFLEGTYACHLVSEPCVGRHRCPLTWKSSCFWWIRDVVISTNPCAITSCLRGIQQSNSLHN